MTKKIKRGACLMAALLFCLCLFPACKKEADEYRTSGFSYLTIGEKERVEAEVALSAADVRAHTGQTAYLYELRPGETADAVAGKEPLDEIKVKSTMRFRFSLHDGDRTRLYSAFAVGFSDGTVLSSDGYYIENPQLLATDTTAFAWSQSPKGLVIDEAADAVDLGCAHAMVEVRFSELLNGGESFSFGGADYTLSESARAAVDAKVKAASDVGMQVSLSLIPDRLPSMETAVALIDHLCARYAGGEYGTVSALFVQTASLPDPATDNGQTFTRGAAELFRAANTALRSRVANGRVYVISHKSLLSDTKIFFTQLQTRLAAGGEVDWGAAVSPTLPSPAWRVTGKDEMSLSALAELRNFLIEENLKASWFALHGLSFSANDPNEQAASYAYAYREAVDADADLIFYASHVGDAAGLRASDGSARPITAMFSTIDSGLDAESLSLCKSIEDLRWSDSRVDLTSRTVVSGISLAESPHFDEKMLFDFTSEDTISGFEGVGCLQAPVSRESGSWKTSVLFTKVGPTYAARGGVCRVLERTDELQGFSSLSWQLLSYVPEAEACAVTLTLEGETKGGERVLYESRVELKNNMWQTAVFYIEEFTALADPSRPCVLRLSTSSDTMSEETPCDLWIHSVCGVKTGTDLGAALPVIVIAVSAVAAMTVALLIYRKTSRETNKR